jgi:hypothetical protein
MSDLITRLEALGGPAVPGDWTDVVARAQRVRSRALRRRLIVSIAVVLLAVPTIAIATGHWDVFSLTATEEDVPLPQGENTLGYAIGDRLYLPGRPPVKLAVPFRPPPFIAPGFTTSDDALLVPSHDGRKVAYHAWEGDWRRGTSVLRVFDTESGSDRVIDRGAHSPAWRRDGALAYTRAVVPEWDPRKRGNSGGRVGHLVVRRNLASPALVWSRHQPQDWRPLAWAGRFLIARGSITVTDDETSVRVPRLYAFSGLLSRISLPLDDLVAVSPDGRLVIGEASPLPQGGGESVLRVVQVQSGQILATLDPRRDPDLETWSGAQPGIWSGATVLVPTGFATRPVTIPTWEGDRVIEGPDTTAVVAFRYEDGALTVDQELKLKREIVEATGLRRVDNMFTGRPVFVDQEERQFTQPIRASVNGRFTSFYVTCDRVEKRCRRGRTLQPDSPWTALMFNPSRPLPD